MSKDVHASMRHLMIVAGIGLWFGVCRGLVAATPDTDHGSQRAAQWSYAAETGPVHWSALDGSYAACGNGRAQSPIDLSDARLTTLPPLARDYVPANLKIMHHEHVLDVIDNGHTIQIDVDDGSELGFGSERYALVQYHFHAPSEHTVDGKHFPMEMHLVHRSVTGHLAVMGVLIRSGAHNDAFDPVWQHLPHTPGETVHLEHVSVDVDDLLPTDHRTWHYGGSLTTPPCDEGVAWFVLHEPIELSPAQIDAFRAIFDGNNRPVQPLHERAVLLTALPDAR